MTRVFTSAHSLLQGVHPIMLPLLVLRETLAAPACLKTWYVVNC